MNIRVSNESYNLADSVDFDVAINHASRLRTQSKNIDAEVEEFAKAFRLMFREGIKHGTGQATLQVNQLGEDKHDALDINKVLEHYGISKETHPQFWCVAQTTEREYNDRKSLDKTRDAIDNQAIASGRV